jgi:replication initiation protein RepC
MMSHTKEPGAGFRRFDDHATSAAHFANQFTGLPHAVTHGDALVAFKRAAGYMKIPVKVVHLVDLLFAWTRAEDWKPPCTPVVWPRNDRLASILGVEVRQVQNLLATAVRLGLITHKDSPNGHRGGVRSPDGAIKWAYGIVLSPIGARYQEFRQTITRGERQDETLRVLRKRLTAARRRIYSCIQQVADKNWPVENAHADYEIAKLATEQLKQSKCLEILEPCVVDLERRAAELERNIIQRCQHVENGAILVSLNTSSDAENCTHSTRTTHTQTAKAATGNGSAEKRSQDTPSSSSTSTQVDEDLSLYGITPRFIASVSSELLGFDDQNIGWGRLIEVAERLVDQNGIHRQAWREACNRMGENGAAASVIAIIDKYHQGSVKRPGAYLRGMTARAVRGELRLGRTYHGLNEAKSRLTDRCAGSYLPADAIGTLARSVFETVRSGARLRSDVMGKSTSQNAS